MTSRSYSTPLRALCVCLFMAGQGHATTILDSGGLEIIDGPSDNVELRNGTDLVIAAGGDIRSPSDVLQPGIDAVLTTDLANETEITLDGGVAVAGTAREAGGHGIAMRSGTFTARSGFATGGSTRLGVAGDGVHTRGVSMQIDVSGGQFAGGATLTMNADAAGNGASFENATGTITGGDFVGGGAGAFGNQTNATGGHGLRLIDSQGVTLSGLTATGGESSQIGGSGLRIEGGAVTIEGGLFRGATFGEAMSTRDADLTLRGGVFDGGVFNSAGILAVGGSLNVFDGLFFDTTELLDGAVANLFGGSFRSGFRGDESTALNIFGTDLVLANRRVTGFLENGDALDIFVDARMEVNLFDVSVAPIPLPAPFWLLVASLGALCMCRRARPA